MASPIFEEFHPDVFWVEFGTTAVVARHLLEVSRKPFFIAVHGYDIATEFKDLDYRKELVSLMNSDFCAGVVCASHFTKRLCVLAGVAPEKTHVIRLGLDGEKIKPSGVVKTEAPSFVHFGRLVEKKNPLATLEAFRLVQNQLPEAQMTFIGDGPLRKYLQERIRKYGLGRNVKLIGALGRDEALAIVESHWVFVQHSVTAKSGDQEGFALSPAEAALLELPVVSTLHNGIPEHVRQGETGFLVAEFNYEEMSTRMLELAESEQLRKKFGSAGRVNVIFMCDPGRRVKDLQQLLEGARL
jgi:glycosyltransferase involved in cell wall biosynthesis